MLSTEQESLNLDFALREKRFACIQNITDGRYCDRNTSNRVQRNLHNYTLFSLVYLICRHTLPLIYCWSSEERLVLTMSMVLGLGAVHPKLSGSTIDMGKPYCIDFSFIHIAYMPADYYYYGNADSSYHSWFMFAVQSS